MVPSTTYILVSTGLGLSSKMDQRPVWTNQDTSRRIAVCDYRQCILFLFLEDSDGCSGGAWAAMGGVGSGDQAAWNRLYHNRKDSPKLH